MYKEYGSSLWLYEIFYLLLQSGKNNTKVEYALRGMTQPLGVAAYKTKELIENLKSSLPSIDDLEKTLND